MYFLIFSLVLILSYKRHGWISFARGPLLPNQGNGRWIEDDPEEETMEDPEEEEVDKEVNEDEEEEHDDSDT